MVSIVSNNCVGGCLTHDLGMQYQSPTVGLQILPEEYPKFCKNIEHYLSQKIIEYKINDFSETHKQYLINMFGNIPHMPYGLCDDIIICFQHYSTFKVGKDAWDRRCKRFNFNDIAYMFYSRDPKYTACVQEFVNYRFNKSVVFTENYDVYIPVEHYKIVPPDGGNFLDIQSDGSRWYEQWFNQADWFKRVERGDCHIV